MTDPPCNEDHHRAIGVRLSRLEEQVRRVHAVTGDLEELAVLSQAIDDMRISTGVDRRATRGNVIGTAIAFMFLDVEELRPQRLRAYGELNDEAATLLEDYVRRLEQIIETLARRLRVGGR